MLWRSIIALLFIMLVTAGVAASAAGNATAAQARAEERQRAATSMLADIRQATWIRDGKSTHVIYVFFDPNCPYCQKVFTMLRPWVERGEVEARWIPIGILMTTSPGKAAAMLEAKNPTEALYRNERGFSQESGNFGGGEEEPVPREETLRHLNANLALLQRTGNQAVPSLLFRTKDGQANIILGAPPRTLLEKLLKEIE